MAMSESSIREVRPDDDFTQIHDLILNTKRTTSRDKRQNIKSAEKLRSEYFPGQDVSAEQACKGFVAEQDGEIIAFMGVHPRKKEDGILDYGVQHYDLQLLSGLLERCSNHVLARGGSKLLYFASTQFAQIRNQEISALEKLGFVISDEFARLTTHLPLGQWKVPDHLDSSHIVAETGFDYNQIYNMMMEDDEQANAEIFRRQYQVEEPSYVILTLRSAMQEITAVACYKVKKMYPHKDYLAATAFQLHFRPQYELPRHEKKRFLQGVLASMKQLNLSNATSSLSLKNVDTFIIMVQEGFDDFFGHLQIMTKTLTEGEGNEPI